VTPATVPRVVSRLQSDVDGEFVVGKDEWVGERPHSAGGGSSGLEEEPMAMGRMGKAHAGSNALGNGFESVEGEGGLGCAETRCLLVAARELQELARRRDQRFEEGMRIYRSGTQPAIAAGLIEEAAVLGHGEALCWYGSAIDWAAAYQGTMGLRGPSTCEPWSAETCLARRELRLARWRRCREGRRAGL
jgi:hypothetical protein